LVARKKNVIARLDKDHIQKGRVKKTPKPKPGRQKKVKEIQPPREKNQTPIKKKRTNRHLSRAVNGGRPNGKGKKKLTPGSSRKEDGANKLETTITRVKGTLKKKAARHFQAGSNHSCR